MTRAGIAALVVVVGAAAAFAGYRYAVSRMEHPPAAAPAAGAERKVLYWYDPMQPQQKFDKPGKSPFMDMQLVPKYADEAAGAGTVSISPQMVQNLGVRTAEAKTGAIEERFEAVGTVAFNERSVVQLQARAAGFVEKLHARAPLDPVKKGAPLVELLYPEWAGAQEEYLLLRNSGSSELAQAARQRQQQLFEALDAHARGLPVGVQTLQLGLVHAPRFLDLRLRLVGEQALGGEVPVLALLRLPGKIEAHHHGDHVVESGSALPV